MQTAVKFTSLIGALGMTLLAGCDNAPVTTPSPAPAGTNSGIDTMALIENANEVVESRATDIADLQPEDVIPPEYLEEPDTGARFAMATLASTEGHEVEGIVVFIQEPALPAEENPDDSIAGIDPLPGSEEAAGIAPAMRIVGAVTGLAPGPHGFHIHAQGDCSAPDASSAGGHFNPGESEHGGPHSAERHAGDLGNITADAYGLSRLDMRDPYVTFSDSNSVMGKAVIVHVNRDNESSQPNGNSGAAVTCGVIEQFRLSAL